MINKKDTANSLEKYMPAFQEYKKSIKLDCIRAKKDLSNKLNMKVEVYPSFSYSGEFIKTVEVRILQDNTDYKSVTVGYGDILSGIEVGMNFEDSLLNSFVSNMLHNHMAVETYKANFFEKSLDLYITHLAMDCNMSNYYVHPDQILIFTGNGTDEEVVYMEEITGLQFITDEVVYIFLNQENPENKDIDYIVLRPDSYEIKKKVQGEM